MQRRVRPGSLKQLRFPWHLSAPHKPSIPALTRRLVFQHLAFSQAAQRVNKLLTWNIAEKYRARIRAAAELLELCPVLKLEGLSFALLRLQSRAVCTWTDVLRRLKRSADERNI